MYQELNNLFVIYYEKNENNKSNPNNNITKRIYFRRNPENKNHKKTIRN